MKRKIALIIILLSASGINTPLCAADEPTSVTPEAALELPESAPGVDPKDVVKACSDALSKKLSADRRASFLFRRALAFEELNRFPEAEADYTAAISLGMKSREVHYRLLRTMKLNGRIDAAIEGLTKLSATKPDSLWVFHGLAVIYEENVKDYALAGKYLRSALDLLEANPEAGSRGERAIIVFQYAVHLARQWKGDRNRKNVLRLLAMAQKSVQYCPVMSNPDEGSKRALFIAALNARLGRYDEAMAEIRTAKLLDPGSITPDMALCFVLAKEGKHHAWCACAHSLLRRVPKAERALDLQLDYAYALYFTKQYSSALAKATWILEHRSDDQNAMCLMGDCYSSLGRFKEALESFDKVMVTNPKGIEAPVKKAILLSTCPDASIRDGKQAVNIALSVLPRNKAPATFAAASLAYAESGSFDEALVYAEKSVAAIEFPAKENREYQRVLDHVKRKAKVRSLVQLGPWFLGW